MQLIRVTALPVLSTSKGGQVFNVSPFDLTPASPVERVVADTWFATNQCVGRLKLPARDLLMMRMTQTMHGFDAIVAATIGQFLGQFCQRHDLMVNVPSFPADQGAFVGDPDFVVMIRETLKTGKIPQAAPKFLPALRLCLQLTERLKWKKKGDPLVVGSSSTMPPEEVMGIGWVMASVFPEHPLALEHAGALVNCRQVLVTPPEGARLVTA